MPTADAVFNAALLHNNSILASRQGIEVAERNISLAKSGYLPTLSFGANVGSSYYTVSGMQSETFGEQMRHNYSTYVGFSLQIPIFNAFSTRNSVRRARIQKLQAELQLDQTQTELFRTIQLAYYQARGAATNILRRSRHLKRHVSRLPRRRRNTISDAPLPPNSRLQKQSLPH